ncbi:MAG TPA: hypothetical protein VJX92_06825 [Methylomirabilota bacterium]|nr:hypothetical protein [Methylomirabilota bacterium]
MLFVSVRYCLLIALLAAASAVSAEPVEYVITFNHVVVRGSTGISDSPKLAHLDPAIGPPPSLHGRPPGDPSLADAGTDLPPTTVLRGRPTQPMAFAPGQGVVNPSFTEQGFLVESFWALHTGTPDAFFRRGHFHPPDLSSGFEAQHLGNPKELHGIYIRSLDGRAFGVKSLRYRVTRNRELPEKPFSVEGFSNYDVNILLARTYDPRWANRVQFVGFPVGLPTGNDLSLPWWTLRVTGFEAVEQVYIASSASVDFDDIVLVRFQSAVEPSKPSE